MSSHREHRLRSLTTGIGALALTTLLGLALASCGEESSPTGNTPVNRAPSAPAIDSSNGTPADGATDVPSSITLHWTCADPDDDDLTYTVHFGTEETPPVVSADQATTSYGPMTVAAGTKFYWRVVATDSDDKSTASPVWSFTTAEATGPETINVPSPPGGPATGDIAQVMTYSAAGAVSSHGHGLQYRFDWADDDMSDWSSATAVQHSWATAAIYGVKVQARCDTHNDIESEWSTEKSVTIVALETVTPPDAPSGAASGETNADLTYGATGAVSSRGHTIEVRFDWGDGMMSNWSTATEASHAWFNVGTYDVRAMARCQDHPDIESEWSAVTSVEIVPPGETIGTPGNGAGAVGPTAGAAGVDQTFVINWPAESNLGHAVEHQFDWDDGEMSEWTTALQGTHAWTTVGTYTVRLRGRCIEHPAVVSDWAESNPTEITDAGETLTDPSISLYTNVVAFNPVIYSMGNVTSNIGDPVEYQMDWDVEGLSDWQDGNQISYAFSVDGEVNLRARARCKVHPDVVSAWSPTKVVPIAEGNSPMEPVMPNAGYVLHEIVFTTQGSVNSSGHLVEYRFLFGSGEGASEWSTSLTASHTYDSPGQKLVKVEARCTQHPDVTRMSAQQGVSLTWQPTDETITTPGKPVGPATGSPNTPIAFGTTACTSNEGHEVWYQFTAVRSGSHVFTTEWSTSLTQELTFTSIGGHAIYAWARCSIHPEARSSASPAGYITISTNP